MTCPKSKKSTSVHSAVITARDRLYQVGSLYYTIMINTVLPGSHEPMQGEATTAGKHEER